MNFENFKQQILQAALSANAYKCLNMLKANSTFSEQIYDIMNKNGDTIVHIAAQFGSLDIIRYCYEQYGLKTLTVRNKDGKMPLHVAVHSGQLLCVEYLLTCNVPVDVLKRADWTPLMLSCTKSDLNIVQTLVKFGANLRYQNKDGWTAFHIAAREGCVDIVKYLLKIDNMVWKTQSKNGRTPLHTAALHGKVDVVKLLLNETAQPSDSVDTCGTTPIMDAVSSCHNEVVHILVDKGASVNQTDRLGKNLLHLAAEAGNIEMCCYLVENCNFDINFKSNHGLTALHFAVKEKNLLCAQKLLELGSDKTVKDHKGRIALNYTTDETMSSLLT